MGLLPHDSPVQNKVKDANPYSTYLSVTFDILQTFWNVSEGSEKYAAITFDFLFILSLSRVT